MIKLNKLFWVLMFLFFVSCLGQGGGGGAEKESIFSHSAVGKWNGDSSCVYFYDDSGSVVIFYTNIKSLDARFPEASEIVFNFYNPDTGWCSYDDKDIIFTLKAKFNLYKTTNEMVENETFAKAENVDVFFDSIQITTKSQTLVDSFNDLNECGKNTWELGKPQEVAGSTCGSIFGVQWKIPAKESILYYLTAYQDNDSDHNGENTLKLPICGVGTDCVFDSPDNRPGRPEDAWFTLTKEDK